MTSTSTHDITVTATDTASIHAYVIAAAVGVGVSTSTTGGSVAIGIAFAQNLIGWDQGLTNHPDQVHAYIQDSDVSAGGALILTATSDPAIVAQVYAAAVAVSVGSNNAFGVGGSGVFTNNKISTDVRAYIQGNGTTPLVTAQSISAHAGDTSSITADAGAASVALAFSGQTSVAVSIAASIALNEIDNDVEAYVLNVSHLRTTAGSAAWEASKAATISTVSVAASIAVGVGGNIGVAVSGAGAGAENVILGKANAFTDNSNLEDIKGGVTLNATDDSDIDATIVAASVAVGAGGQTGVGVSIGVAVARNYIGWNPKAEGYTNWATEVTLNPSDYVIIIDTKNDTLPLGAVYQYVGSTSTTLNLSEETSYSGSLWKQILVETASPRPASLTATDRVLTTQGPRTGEIYEYSGPTQTGAAYDYTSTQSAKLVQGMRVKASNGTVYRYVGSESDTPVSLSGQDYTNTNNWAAMPAGVDLVSQDYSDTSIWTQIVTEKGTQVQAYAKNSRVNATGELKATATSSPEIDATVVAGSVALSGGGNTGVAVSGAGVFTLNKIATNIKAFIDGDGPTTTGAIHEIKAGSVTLQADDSSEIHAVAAGASVAGSVGGSAGVSVSIGLSVALNEINNQVAAYIANADNYVQTTVGGITIKASESAVIDTTSAAASLAATFGGTAGVAVSGAGAVAINKIFTDTNAYIVNSQVESATFIDMDASSSGSIDAVIVAASVALAGGGTAGIGASIGISIAHNQIGSETDPAQVRAYIQDSTVNAKGGALTLDASGASLIRAVVVAGSAAVAGGGAVGVGVSGSGVGATNLIIEDVKAFIDGSGASGIHGNSIWLAAQDTSVIIADAAAASLAASFAGAVSVSLSIGVSIGRNEIRNNVEAYIVNAPNVGARAGDIVIRAGTKEDPSGFPSDYSASGYVALKRGDLVKASGDQVYRFLGEGQPIKPTYASSDGTVQLKGSDTVRVVKDQNDGGTVGAIYQYTGSDTEIDLAEIDYSTGNWVKVVEPALYNTSSGKVDIKTGDSVEVIRGYAIVHSSDETNVGLTNDKTYVRISRDYVPAEGVTNVIAGTIYKYVGTTGGTANLTTEDYSDTDRWVRSSPEDQFGVGGTFYQYTGPNANDLDLGLQDYTTGNWQQITRDLAAEDFSNQTYWAKVSSITALSCGGFPGRRDCGHRGRRH